MLPHRVLSVCRVGLRAAVTKDDYAADLHLLSPSQTLWSPQAIATGLYSSSAQKNAGTGGVQTFQFVGPSNDAQVNAITDAFKTKYSVLAPLVRRDFASDDDLDHYVRSVSYATTASQAAVYGAVSFQSTGPEWAYTIRGNSTAVSGQTSLDTSQSLVNRLSTTYTLTDFATLDKEHLLLQNFVEQYILETQTGAHINITRDVSFQPFRTTHTRKHTRARIVLPTD